MRLVVVMMLAVALGACGVDGLPAPPMSGSTPDPGAADTP